MDTTTPTTPTRRADADPQQKKRIIKEKYENSGEKRRGAEREAARRTGTRARECRCRRDAGRHLSVREKHEWTGEPGRAAASWAGKPRYASSPPTSRFAYSIHDVTVTRRARRRHRRRRYRSWVSLVGTLRVARTQRMDVCTSINESNFWIPFKVKEKKKINETNF